MKIKLGVIFGGKSVEHEVSIISALQAISFLNPEKYDIIPIYIDKDSNWYTGKMLEDMSIYSDFDNLKKFAKKVVFYKKNGSFVLQTTGFFKRVVEEIDIVFPIVHGNNIEDGTIQGYLSTLGVPYVGSSILGSSIGQDKVIMKQVMEQSGLPIVSYTWFWDFEYSAETENILNKIKNVGYPVIVKPANLGSSVGITYVETEEKIEEAVREAIKYDRKIVVEKAVSNLQEINCSVIGNYSYQEVSVLEEVISSENFLTYEDKYIGDAKGGKSKGMVSTNRIIPASLEKNLEQEIKDLTKAVFKVLNLGGLCRIDYLVDKKTGKVYVNEPNTIPGSLAFYLWEPAGKKYPELLDELITIAIKDFQNKSKKIVSFETNILTNFGGLKGAKGSKTKFRK